MSNQSPVTTDKQKKSEWVDFHCLTPLATNSFAFKGKDNHSKFWSCPLPIRQNIFCIIACVVNRVGNI